MPNFTNKAKLKKPLVTEYFNINDMNENMDKIEDEFYTTSCSEDLLNESIASFKVGTGKVNGVAKDYSSQMEQSLVIVYDLEGNEVYHGLHNSNDTITLSTAITSVHRVQLNTKAQVEEVQDVVQKEKKSIWQKIKELTDFRLETGDWGYFKFPTILGGLLIQWGYIYWGTIPESTTMDYIFNFPVTFSNKVYFVTSGDTRASSYFGELVSHSCYLNLSQGSVAVSNFKGYTLGQGVSTKFFVIGK